MTENRGEFSGLLIAFVAGALVGLGVGLLVAPQPGRQSRKALADLAKRARRTAEEAATSLRQEYAAGSRPTDERADA